MSNQQTENSADSSQSSSNAGLGAVEVGKTYLINSQRKGTFMARVARFDGFHARTPSVNEPHSARMSNETAPLSAVRVEPVVRCATCAEWDLKKMVCRDVPHEPCPPAGVCDFWEPISGEPNAELTSGAAVRVE